MYLTIHSALIATSLSKNIYNSLRGCYSVGALAHPLAPPALSAPYGFPFGFDFNIISS